MWLKWRLAGCVQPFLVGHFLLSLISIPSLWGVNLLAYALQWYAWVFLLGALLLFGFCFRPGTATVPQLGSALVLRSGTGLVLLSGSALVLQLGSSLAPRSDTLWAPQSVAPSAVQSGMPRSQEGGT